MNIWIFNHYATTPNFVGGTRHYDLASELVKRGHEVTIFASSFNHFLKKETMEYPDSKNYVLENINGVNFVWVKTKGYKRNRGRIINILDYTSKTYKISKKIISTNRPDLVIGSSVHPLAAYLGYKISKKSSSIFYFEERDLWPQTFIDFGKMSKNNPIAKILYSFEHFLYTKARKVIVLFDKAEEYVASRGIERNKVVYIPNGVSIERYTEVKEDKSLKESLPPKKILIYTGSHGIANDLDPLIEAAKILKNKNASHIHIVLVGDGSEKKKLLAKSKQYTLDNVTFLDPVTKDKIPYLLSLADLSFISIKNSPLYKWGFSMNKLYDYMASGLPIMIHSSKEVIGELSDVQGIELAENPEQLANIIIDRIDDNEYKEQAGVTLKKLVEENYSWDKLSDKIENTIKADLIKEGFKN